MNKRGTGISFIAIAALLFSTKYIAAAIFGSNITSWDEELFKSMLSYIGRPLSTMSFLALLIGISYIGWAEFEEIILKKKANSL
ncbi:hypothetical protein GPDM_02315 [Planococcus donghaensis MPA1U2]|uniref:Uncharacterized protein n=1 Tax=Planococcus donghaensis MPA1U2 TaxID=933115 RepID=E7RDD5_9BACL|nr:hypothetical protein [Planococcus donghaensis]EGA90939.1 hypothetical protein GPDM_02315 [Planococcus donghaensis MPA1U2]